MLYVHPSKQGISLTTDRQTMGRPYGLMPMGVIALANALRGLGLRVEGIDLPLELRLDRDFDLGEWLASHAKAGVVLIDLHWYEHAFGALDVARICRRTLPHAWVVLGGLTATAYAGEILRDHEAVDVIVRGDGESPLASLVPRLLRHPRSKADDPTLDDIPNLSYRRGAQVVETPTAYTADDAQLDTLEYCDLSFLQHPQAYRRQQYVLPGAMGDDEPQGAMGHWLAIARGCTYECSYCGGCRSAHRALAGREGLVRRSPGRVARDLALLAASGVMQASLSHDLSQLGDGYWGALFREMARHETTIGLYNECFQLPSDAFVEAYAANACLAHSCVALSPLSGNERVRRLNGKAFSDDGLFHTLGCLRAEGVPIIVYFSLNLPGEDEETFEDTVSLARRVCAFYPPQALKVLNTLHTLDPLSPMARHPDQFGIRASLDTFAGYYRYCAMTALAGGEARVGLHRGFVSARPDALLRMADRWDALRQEHPANILPVPPSW